MTITTNVPPERLDSALSAEDVVTYTGESASPVEERLSCVASRVLRQKLDSVVAAIPPAVENWEQDPEHIHRLRVATRRATSALKAFASLLPYQRARRLRRELSRLRRAVGEARDLDVLAIRLRKRSGGLSQSKRKKALKLVGRQRRKVQKHVVAAQTRMASIDLADRSDALLKRVRWRSRRPEPSFREASDQLLQRAIIDFRAATYMDVASIDAIHQLRIEAKLIRYTLELFDSDNRCFPELRSEIRALQNRLGDLNDCAAARERFLAWARKAKSQKRRRLLKQLAKDQQRMLKKEARDFRQWWPDAQVQLRNLLKC